MISLHARVGKPFRKKCKKTCSGVPPEQRTPGQDLKMRKCVYCKVKEPRDRTHRKWQQERDPERPAPTLHRRACFFLKNAIFEKNVIFPTYNGNWTLGPNIGASLRRPNWPCPEALLLFYKICFKKRAALLRDAISA